MDQIIQGDALDVLRTFPDCSVHCCVTSPPYWGLRDYGVSGQLGLEATPQEYVSKMVDVFREVRRVLRDDGTLWLNLGDSYGAVGGDTYSGFNHRWSGTGGVGSKQNMALSGITGRQNNTGLRPKNLVGIPWRVAFALQEDGWYLRQDIIWHKPNPMPESVTDRCTKAHEYIFLMAKSPRYYYDQKAVSVPVAASTVARLSQPNLANQAGSTRVPGKTNGNMKAAPPRFGGNKYGDSEAPETRTKSGNAYETADGRRNRRSVWTVATQPFSGAHFATFPPDLIKPCILAGCPEGGIVLDPFFGSGTTGVVATQLGREYLGIELNPEYAAMARNRIEREGELTGLLFQGLGV